MAKSERGKPFILVRLTPETFDKLREAAGDSERGRGGGMSHYVRKLIHQALDLPEPEPFATAISPRKLRKAEGRPRGRPPKSKPIEPGDQPAS